MSSAPVGPVYVSVPMDLPTSAYVILGMLRLGPLDEARHGPRSGYDIQRSVDVSVRFFWNLSPAQIYPELKRLEKAGLAQGRSEPRGRRKRRVYELTPAGEAELQAWLRRPEPTPFEVRDLALLKLFFADALDTEDALELVRALRSRSELTLDELRTRAMRGAEISQQKGDQFPLAAGILGFRLHELLIKFADDLEAEIKAQQRTSA
jgi:DNA-binding PadR family transcriptional regulator